MLGPTRRPARRRGLVRRYEVGAAVVRVAMAAYLLASLQTRLHAAASSPTRVVHTRYGKMRGVVAEASGAAVDRPKAAVEMFLGIPYATPPTGPNRFSPTRALTPWEGVKVADQFGAVCPQWLPDIGNETEALRRMPKGRLEHLKRLLPHLRNQSEDCLYLNIYAPAAGDKRASERKYPVLVYFHGESYSWNSGNPYDGRILASYANLIVVTFNYRLGVLGFLNVNAEPFQRARVANYGLMDQIAALHWIQQNIANFDGDPNNVTLVGHGTGAACVNFLMISPAVMPALSSWALVEEPILYSMEIARQMNCSRSSDEDTKNADRIVDCLRQVPLAQLTGAHVAAPTFLNAFGPSIDGVVIRADFHRQLFAGAPHEPHAYVKTPPIHHRNVKPRGGDAVVAVAAPKTTVATSLHKYDLLFGCVTSEALFGFGQEDIQSGFEGERRDRILRTYIRNAYDYHLSEIFYTVVNEYTDWERTVLHPINTRDSTVAALSDAQFVAPLVQTGDLFSRSVASHTSAAAFNGNPRTVNQHAAIKAKTFFYVFDYQTKDGDYPQRMGTVHGEDLPYIFGAPLAESPNHFSRNFTKQEAALSEALMIYVGNFARVGNPNEYQKQEPTLPISKERNRFKGMVWEEYDPIHQKYLEISAKPKMKNHFRAHQLSVWLRLIPELHRAGMEDVTVRHNLFHSHESGLYEGMVRADKHASFSAVQSQTSRRSYSTPTRNGTVAEIVRPITTFEPLLATCAGLPAVVSPAAAAAVASASATAAGVLVRSDANYTESGAAFAAADGNAVPSGAVYPPVGNPPYSTSLALTVAIGCTLLVLNALIYAFVYYQRDKTRTEIKSLREQQMQRLQLQLQQQQQQQQQQRQSQFAGTVDSAPGSPFSAKSGRGGEGAVAECANFGPHPLHTGSAKPDSDANVASVLSSHGAATLPRFVCSKDGNGASGCGGCGSGSSGEAAGTCDGGVRNGGRCRRSQHHPHRHTYQPHYQRPHHQHQQEADKYHGDNASGPAKRPSAAHTFVDLDEGPTTGRNKSPLVAACEQPRAAAAATNGSVFGHQRQSTATPSSPLKHAPAPEAQPLLHGAAGAVSGAVHVSSLTQSLHKCAVLKVPVAAISEMRV